MNDIKINGHLFAICFAGRKSNPVYVCLNCRYEMPNIIMSSYNLKDPVSYPLTSCGEYLLRQVLL